MDNLLMVCSRQRADTKSEIECLLPKFISIAKGQHFAQIFWVAHFLGCAAERAEMCVLCTDSHQVGNHSSPTMRKQLFCSLRVASGSLFLVKNVIIFNCSFKNIV